MNSFTHLSQGDSILFQKLKKKKNIIDINF